MTKAKSTTKKTVYKLDKIDSVMFSQMLDYKKDNTCNKEYLHAIKGFYLDTLIIRTDEMKKLKRFMSI